MLLGCLASEYDQSYLNHALIPVICLLTQIHAEVPPLDSQDIFIYTTYVSDHLGRTKNLIYFQSGAVLKSALKVERGCEMPIAKLPDATARKLRSAAGLATPVDVVKELLECEEKDLQMGMPHR